MPEMIDHQSYRQLYAKSRQCWDQIKVFGKDKKEVRSRCKQILQKRASGNSIDLEEVSFLLLFLRKISDRNIYQAIIETARNVRESCFGKSVACMVPLELSSFCASNCSYCEWGSDNSVAARYTISEKALITQIKTLARRGFTHFELAIGDDVGFLKRNLKKYVEIAKSTAIKLNAKSRVSLCATPLPAQFYRELKSSGLDAILTWQETYSEKLFYKHTFKGPKAHGITNDFVLQKQRQGYYFRLESVESAIQSGLQVGIGTMLGLNGKVEVEILALLGHAKMLLEHYPLMSPLIIGMPILNAIPTGDHRQVPRRRGFNPEQDFQFVAALYLLAMPNNKAWVFPNCRVSFKTQIAAVRSAGFFTSTMVQLMPGGYLAGSDIRYAFVKKAGNGDKRRSEQFFHYYHDHKHFLEEFKKYGLKQAADADFL